MTPPEAASTAAVSDARGAHLRGWRRLRAVPKRAWATFLAVLAAGPASVGLVFTLWPGLAPDPGDRLAAELHATTIDRNVTLREYLTDLGERSAGKPVTPGAVVYVSVNIQGRKHHDLKLFYRVYDDASRVRVRPADVPGLGPIGREAASYFRADTPNDRWIAPVWIPSSSGVGRVFVRFELYDGDSMLAFTDSHAFAFPAGRALQPDP
jgi:hypothetical protein